VTPCNDVVRYHNPEHYDLNVHRFENLISHINKLILLSKLPPERSLDDLRIKIGLLSTLGTTKTVEENILISWMEKQEENTKIFRRKL